MSSISLSRKNMPPQPSLEGWGGFGFSESPIFIEEEA